MFSVIRNAIDNILSVKSPLEGMFINMESAQCRGIVTSWRYRFYIPSGHFSDSTMQFTARLMLYRKNSLNSDKFHRVRESVAQLRLQWSNIRNFTFQCQDKVLIEREHLEVLQNDRVGVSFRDGLLTYPIPLVGISKKTI